MFHRPVFNFICLAMILVHAIIPDPVKKMGALQLLFFVILFLALAARPYRNVHSNVINIALSMLFALITFELNMKVSGFKSTLFVDKYFYAMQLIQNLFFWVMIGVYTYLIYKSKANWMVDKDFINNVTAGQEMAIIYIQKAKIFKDRVVRTRVFETAERAEMETHMTNLEKEFNNLASKQPICMDAMLETMENIKQMRKNYDLEPDVYNFDYKQELDKIVKERARVYGNQQLNFEDLDDEDSTEDVQHLVSTREKELINKL